jgi:hypothetical protein
MKTGLANFSKNFLVGTALCAVLSGPAASAAHLESVQRAQKFNRDRSSAKEGAKKKDQGGKHSNQPTSEPSLAVITSSGITKSAEGKSHSAPPAQAVCSAQGVRTQDGSVDRPDSRHAIPAMPHEPAYRAHAPPADLFVR